MSSLSQVFGHDIGAHAETNQDDSRVRVRLEHVGDHGMKILCATVGKDPVRRDSDGLHSTNVVEDCTPVALPLSMVDKGADVDGFAGITDSRAQDESDITCTRTISRSSKSTQEVLLGGVTSRRMGIQWLIHIIGQRGPIWQGNGDPLADRPRALHSSEDAVHDSLDVSTETPKCRGDIPAKQHC